MIRDPIEISSTVIYSEIEGGSMEKEQFEALMDLAMEREIESAKFYHDLAIVMDNPVVSDIFLNLSKDEEEHRSFLDNYKQQPYMHLKFKEIEAYHLNESEELPLLTMKMKPEDAISLAIKKEQLAVEFYTDLANRSVDDDIRNTCLELAKMEHGHKVKLESQFELFMNQDTF